VIAPDLRYDEMLSPGLAAVLLRVDPRTLAKWADAGKIGVIRTPGGHRRYPVREIERITAGLAGRP